MKNHPPRTSRLMLTCATLLLSLAQVRVSLSQTLPAVTPHMLALPGTDGDPTKIDYAKLPVLKGEYAVVCPFDEQWKFQLHNYLLHHDGKFWCMWSAGPEAEDLPTQEVRYATSDDGLKWSAPKTLTGPPAEGRGYIARSFWVRNGELLALAASYQGRGAFGVNKDLKLVAFAWDKAASAWKPRGPLFENAINNFPPQKLSTGEWMMTRRDARWNVSMLIGGVKAFDDWRVAPVIDLLTARQTCKFSPDEPVWWEQPDGLLVASFRDNSGTNRLFRAFSRDHGQTWSAPEKTNYPNSPSKLFPLRTSRGYRVLISNANPAGGRRELYLGVSEDGLTFTRLARLHIPPPTASTFQYPHAIEHDGHLFIAYSNKKLFTALLKVPLDEVERLRHSTASVSNEAAPPHPVNNPASPLMLAGDWVPKDTHQIDFDHLPRVLSLHSVVVDVRADKTPRSTLDLKNGGMSQHNYLTHHDGKYWIMWSEGPGIEDRVGQRVKFATSSDGLQWGSPQFITPEPPGSGPDSKYYATRTLNGFRYIARGFWKRDGELLALASLDEAAGFFGPSLQLRAFRFDAKTEKWTDAGLVYNDTINNFPPLKLRTGNWMMSRRAHDYRKTGAHFIVGGVKGIDQWESHPVLGSNAQLAAEEPDWWILPDDTLSALFRDNNNSGFLYRSFSHDDGRTWSYPVKTNFPDATSKISGLRLSDGRYVLVSNANPKKRDPLVLSLSNDGIVFHKMVYLVGGRWIDYPHVIEHDGHLLIAFAGGKQTVEVLKVRLADLDQVEMKFEKGR